MRKANPKTGEAPTPDRGGLLIRVSKTGNFYADWDITVQNCVVMNTAPTQGALSVFGYKGSKITIRNNIIINNTSSGIFAGSSYHPRDGKDKPKFLIENNSVFFTWKYDPMAQSFSGNSIKFDADTANTVQNNVFGFADKYGVHNAGKASLRLNDNIITGNLESDYLEFDTDIAFEDIEDEAEYLRDGSEANLSGEIQVPASREWAEHYGSRILIDRNAREADIRARQSRVNAVRAMLGLPLQAGAMKSPAGPVWLNRLSVDDAIKAGATKYLDKYGSAMPVPPD
ncbi:MAG: hypothetical protein GY862_24855 [Gammaproteobacteria bacterium]|nr:hypothetical protein [Gammaproteobacteria bacterium]